MFPLILLLVAFFLFPIAVYCTVLGMINRRPHPLMVSGAWDFLGVLLATSGFLLFIGPALISGGFRQGLRELPLQRDSTSLGNAISDIWASWWVLWVIYYLMILVGAAFLLWLRRGTTVIYNVEPSALDAALATAANRSGLSVHRRGNKLYFAADTASGLVDALPLDASPAAVVFQPVAAVHHSLVVDVEPFPLLCNATLHWRSGTPRARADLERELQKSLREVLTLDNSAGAWLMGIGGFLFLLIMLLTAVFVLVLIPVSRR